MADPLTLLRQYYTTGKSEEIVEAEGQIVFGDLAWPKDVRTNFKAYGTESDYYTLECLLYFLKNIKQSHAEYVRQARGEVPIVRRPDRRDLTGYLDGTIQKKDLKSIDQSAPLQMPTNFKRSAGDQLESGVAGKKPRLADHLNREQQHSQSEMKKRLADKLNTDGVGKAALTSKPLKNLSDDLTTDKIAAIRAKLLSNRRTRVKPEDDDAKTASIGLGDLEANRESRDIFSRERVWRNRTTILQSSGKTFSKTVTAILGSIRAREDGRAMAGRHPGAHNPSMAPPPPGAGAPGAQRLGGMAPQRQALPNYNRYDQEQFRTQDDTHEFNIDKTGTFSGMTLKSVTEGNQAARNKAIGAAALNAAGQKPKMAPGTNPNSPGGTGAQSPAGGGSSGKRPSRTPIIIIPAAPKSMITMYNAKDILQDLRFLSTDDKKSRGEKRENELLIQRRKESGGAAGGGLTVPYRVIDNPAKLTNADWDRVVAVFVMGQAWQFKGWPWEGNPTVIFSKVAAYHIKWDDSVLERNIGSWAVSVIQLSRDKRHLDRARLMSFWESLDRYMVNNKPHLRF